MPPTQPRLAAAAAILTLAVVATAVGTTRSTHASSLDLANTTWQVQHTSPEQEVTRGWIRFFEGGRGAVAVCNTQNFDYELDLNQLRVAWSGGSTLAACEQNGYHLDAVLSRTIEDARIATLGAKPHRLLILTTNRGQRVFLESDTTQPVNWYPSARRR